jgi:hypothetical protein
MWYLNLKKKIETFISRHILHGHWYHWQTALPVSQNLQHGSFLTIISATSRPLFQPICHQQDVKISKTQLWTASCNKHKDSHHKQETFIYEYPLHWVFFNIKKPQTERCSLVVHSTSTALNLTTKTSSVHTCLLSRLSWSWTVLLPRVTHRKHIMSTTAVLLSFLTYLLTLPHPNSGGYVNS